MPPPDERTNEERHEAHAQEFIKQLDDLLVLGLKLSQTMHPEIFVRRADLLCNLSNLLAENTWTAEARESRRLKALISRAMGNLR